jgi:branched-chain amino acid transport system substrate-binding protein
MKNLGKKFYILAADYNYGHISTDWVKKYVAQAAGQVVGSEFIPLDVAEFSSVITKLQEAKSDVVFSLLVGGNHIAFYRQFSASGLRDKMKIVSATFGLGNEQVVVAPEESKDIVAVYPYFQEIDTPANKQFVAMWHEEFGKDYAYITDSAVTVWNGWHLWANAVGKAGSTDREKVIKALESGISFDGPSGTVTIDGPSHHVYQNTHFARTNDKHGFTVLGGEKNVPPAFEKKMCDLIKKPNQHKQFLPEAK